jgi:putative hemolysin
MPRLGSHAEKTREPVLSRVVGLPGFSRRFSGQRLAAKFTAVGKVRDLYRRVQESPDGFTLENLLSAMRIRLRVDAADEARIPASGPTVVVANHPYGVLDGAILTALLRRVRPDVKILTNFLLGDIPELTAHCIFVDPFHSDRSVECNRRAVREALAWLEGGGMLAVFPAGEVSHLQMLVPQIADPKWNDTAVRLLRRTRASALPVYFCGHNGVGFQLLGLIHPRLRTAFLLQQLLEQEGKTVEVRIGSEIPNDSIAEIETDRDALEYLRWRTYLLGRRKKTETSWPVVLRSRFVFRMQEEIAPPIASELLEEEIAALSPDRCLAQNGDLAVYLGSARETPNLLQEIGRLREVTFRQAGEGTGKSLDLDRFDDSYWHIVLWNKLKHELVGAYRAGNTAEVLAIYGISGLYTSTLFRYDERLFEKLGPALELGRSFIRPEYQRQYAPLMLLWKGIARLIATHPEIVVLFGAVSISNEYSKASREMIYRFFQSRAEDDELTSLVEPRQPFRPGFLHPWECRGLRKAIRDLDQLSHPIKDLESDGKGLPILLRQYDKLGGKLVAFNVDRKFSDVLDGLVVVDLRQTGSAVLDRYMGTDAAKRFRELHHLAQ